MHKLKNIFFVFLLLYSGISYSLHDSLINKLDYKPNLTRNRGPHISFGGSNQNNIKANWLYFNCDNPLIKLNNQNDTGFKVIPHTCMNIIDLEDEDEDEEDKRNSVAFNGLAWYKLYFKLEPGFEKKMYSLTISQLGATEVYLDGELIKSIGSISKDGKTLEALRVDEDEINYFVGDTLVHVLALRYSSSDFETYYKKYKYYLFGPALKFDIENNYSKEKLEASLTYTVANMIGAFFIALFIIHLLIFLFYREKKFHLFYSLFLLFLSLCFFELYFIKFIEEPKTFLWINHIDSLFFPTCCFFLVTLLNKLLNVKRTRHYMFFVAMMVLLVITKFFFIGFSDAIMISMIFYTYFNTLAHSIVGIRRKIPSGKFLGWGILSFTISIIVLIVLGFLMASVFNNSDAIENFMLFIFIAVIIIGILSIPVSMTAYLAFDFARTNKDLFAQLKANEALNQKSLEQEKEKQEILENQNKLLETQVAERTKEIGEQNKVLEHQKKEITDSINYAKRIQQALLPELDAIKAALPNSFVYYEPKDIVSGDFYFFNSFSGKEDHPGRISQKEESGLFIAAADCTGHGVPGALMSMIVHEKLENATKFHGEPGEILHSVNKQVKDALKQHQTDASRDGCDIALCKIQGTTLSYAGAYRPLYVFYKNGEFKEIKATKTAIAGLTPYEQKFEQHQFNTTELKAIYMFSDGYADQFGGQKSKKLTTKKFKELLHSLVNSPIKEQNVQLEGFFNKWKGNVEQIDDVLVIGITFL